jgi:DNA-binding CsgD family transcriptional regulator
MRYRQAVRQSSDEALLVAGRSPQHVQALLMRDLGAAGVGAQVVAHPSPIESAAEALARAYGFSEAESEVVLLAARDGLCMKEIACRRGVSQKTIQAQWARIYEKTGSASQVAVMAILIRVLAGELVLERQPGKGQCPMESATALNAHSIHSCSQRPGESSCK